MRIDSHMHVWSFEGVEYYDNKQLFTYMEELSWTELRSSQ